MLSPNDEELEKGLPSQSFDELTVLVYFRTDADHFIVVVLFVRIFSLSLLEERRGFSTNDSMEEVFDDSVERAIRMTWESVREIKRQLWFRRKTLP